MKILVTVVLLGCLAACGSTDVGVARDPAGPSPTGSSRPAPDGVQTLGPATVMDTGRPELCLGAVAESWPPQCSGHPIAGWDWSAYDGAFERHGDVRWGEFVVTGRWDGSTFVLVEAVPR